MTLTERIITKFNGGDTDQHSKSLTQKKMWPFKEAVEIDDEQICSVSDLHPYECGGAAENCQLCVEAICEALTNSGKE